MQSLIAPSINLAILIGVLVYYLREPLGQLISARHISVKEEVSKAASQLKEAQEKFEEFSSKLKTIDAEISLLCEQAKQDGKAMRLRILSDARHMNMAIISDARAASESLVGELRDELRSAFGERVIHRAEEMLRARLTGDDRVRIRREFSKQVGSFQ